MPRGTIYESSFKSRALHRVDSKGICAHMNAFLRYITTRGYVSVTVICKERLRLISLPIRGVYSVK
jgi:hypothetical protein